LSPSFSRNGSHHCLSGALPWDTIPCSVVEEEKCRPFLLRSPSSSGARPTSLPLLFDFVKEAIEAALTVGRLLPPVPPLVTPALYKEPETSTFHSATSPGAHFHFFSLQSTCRRAPPLRFRVVVASQSLPPRHLISPMVRTPEVYSPFHPCPSELPCPRAVARPSSGELPSPPVFGSS
jgi:hypothetical protein